MIKSDGKRLDITLLRPTDWISESKAAIGATIILDLPEMGAQGMAKVLNIEPCPLIKPGKGNIITGTFHHEAANTIDLYVEGLSKPIGTTDNHPFWSVTRQEFIEAGKLHQGEKLQLYNGQTAKVIQILPRPGPERVHNLEVMNEHVYRVSDSGVLVHNMCEKLTPKSPFPTKNVTAREVVRILKDNGFQEVRQNGSHLILKHNNGNTTIVPMHSGVTIKQGTLNSIWTMAGLK
jgi:predicted RNA binding protein YcfA (HicA-like mRNA interferase family)